MALSGYQFDWSVIEVHFDQLIQGALLTLALTATAFVAGSALALALALGRTEGAPWLRRIIISYVEIVRNTPFLVQILIMFFGLPAIGVRLSADAAAVVAMTLNFSGYASEIFRSGLASVPRSHLEAAYALGLSKYQAFRFVKFPEALISCFPALSSQATLLMLGSSVASAIGADELSATANIIGSETFRSFEAYAAAAIIYLLMTVVIRSVFNLMYSVWLVPPGFSR
jgi:polar amino acid transport system permease protein